MDQNKKTMRHFYCRDVLWETFEQMANDFDCSIDYLINEAMRHYARSKNYNAGQTLGPSTAGPQGMPPGLNSSSMSLTNAAASAGAPAKRASGPLPPPPLSEPPRRAPSAPLPPPAPPPRRAPAPPPPAARNNGLDSSLGGSPTLYLIYNNQRYAIDKDQFIIGRGSKTSDLPIKDGNISRKHAAVIRRNGSYYIKDLGSTNGIDYRGMRIDNKRIDEGDVFHICDYELRFTFR
jgi:hypothetical protein